MAKILLGWEYGSGFGHVSLMLPLAKALKNAGHEPIMALRDPASTRPMWESSGITVIPAPHIRLPNTWDRSFQTDTLADIFILAGLDDPKKLITLSQAWENTLKEIQPDVVVCEFAPTLALVILGRIPTITMGTSFWVPPSGMPLMHLRYWIEDQTLSDTSRKHEALLLDAIQTASKAIGQKEPEFVSDLFGGEEVFICTLPEMDSYRTYRTTPPIGPLTELAPPELDATAPQKREGIFAYLTQDDDGLPQILDALHRSGFPCDSYVRRFKPDTMIHDNTDSPLIIHETPQPLPDILPHKALLIHHGGIATSDQGLRLGVPQLVIPRHLEQKINGALLLHTGVAEVIMAPECQQNPEKLINCISNMLNDPRYQQRAEQKAKDIASRPKESGLDIMVNACTTLALQNA